MIDWMVFITIKTTFGYLPDILLSFLSGNCANQKLWKLIKINVKVM